MVAESKPLNTKRSLRLQKTHHLDANMKMNAIYLLWPLAPINLKQSMEIDTGIQTVAGSHG